MRRFVQLTRCQQGSKINHLPDCSCTTEMHLSFYQHFHFHYKFIIQTPLVRGFLRRLSCLSHEDVVSDPGVL